MSRAVFDELRRKHPAVLFIPANQRVLRRLAEFSGDFTVNRALRAAEEAGALRLGRGRLEVLDRNQLEQLSHRHTPA